MMRKFKPIKREPRESAFQVRMRTEILGRAKTAAKHYNLTIAEFIDQATEFALDNMETKKER